MTSERAVPDFLWFFPVEAASFDRNQCILIPALTGRPTPTQASWTRLATACSKLWMPGIPVDKELAISSRKNQFALPIIAVRTHVAPRAQIKGLPYVSHRRESVDLAVTAQHFPESFEFQLLPD